jgi:hypothetical protein
MNFLSNPAAGRERILSGSVENAAQSTQGLLRDWGLEATSSKKGESVCIRSSTQRGREFSVMLTRTSDGQTRVRLEWDGAEDDELGMCLLTHLEHLTSVRTSLLLEVDPEFEESPSERKVPWENNCQKSRHLGDIGNIGRFC